MAKDTTFDCRCGTTLEAKPPVAADVPVRRCGGCGAIARNDDELCEYCGSGVVRIVDRGSLICPECYARNLDDGRFCLGCGVAFDPQSPPSSAPDLRCPCCECWMNGREVGGLEIQECPKCHGLWAPEDRFGSLVERATIAAQGREKEGQQIAPRVDGGNPADQSVVYRRCPVCDAQMMRRNFKKRSGVIIDQCHSHGTWLDAQELERIAGFVLSGRAERVARIEQIEESKREEKAAREAALRMQGVFGESSRSHAGFGDRSDTSSVGTIFDFLIRILN